VLVKGIPAFTQSNLHLSVTYDPAIIKIEPAPIRAEGQSDADYTKAYLGWQRKVALLNWNKVVEASLRAAAPAGYDIDSKALLTIAETDSRHAIRERFVADPSLLG
jgi:phosphate transport system permease protein